jgi:hypothetical protein
MTNHQQHLNPPVHIEISDDFRAALNAWWCTVEDRLHAQQPDVELLDAMTRAMRDEGAIRVEIMDTDLAFTLW